MRTLPPDGLPRPIRDRIERAVGAKLEVVGRFPATSSTVLAVRTGSGRDLVVRLFTNTAWLEAEPDLAVHEAAALQLVAGAPVPTPEVVALVEGGTGDVPAVVTTRLPGAAYLPDRPQEGWLRTLAEVAVAIAAVPTGRFPWTYDPWIASEPQVPDRGSALWARAVDVASGAEAVGPVVLLHRDHHPMNLLFGGGRLTGVVDWVNACVGPAAVDVAHCRINLAAMYGREVADRFRDLWCGLTGLRYDPVWDVVTLVGTLPIRPYPPWAAAGLAVGVSEMRVRLERVLAVGLDALGA